MISYEPLWEQLKEKQITLYALEHKHGFSSTTLQRMKKGKVISTVILNDLCDALECRVEDILLFVKDEEGKA